MITLGAEMEGEKQVSRRLGIMADGVKTFREPLQSITGELKQSFDDNFDSRGGLFGRWAERQQDYPWPILERTGTMRNSFRDRVTAFVATIWNTAPYFKYHQSKKPRSTNLPRRVMMKIDFTRKTFITKAFQAYLINLKRRGD